MVSQTSSTTWRVPGLFPNVPSTETLNVAIIFKSQHCWESSNPGRLALRNLSVHWSLVKSDTSLVKVLANPKLLRSYRATLTLGVETTFPLALSLHRTVNSKCRTFRYKIQPLQPEAYYPRRVHSGPAHPWLQVRASPEATSTSPLVTVGTIICSGV